MKSKNIQIFCFLLLTSSVFFAACGSKSDSSSTSEPASLAMKGTSGNAVNMNGTWTRCTHRTTDQQDELMKETFSGSSFTLTSSTWSATTTANCQQTTTPDVLVTGTATATLGAEAVATWTNGSGSTSPPAGIAATAKATKSTAVIHSLTLTPGSDAMVNAFNTSAYCGKTNWAKGVATDVLNCSAFISSSTMTDYWVVDDSAAVLKWYSSMDSGATAYQVGSTDPMLK